MAVYVWRADQRDGRKGENLFGEGCWRKGKEMGIPRLKAHSSIPTPVFLSSREETQAMARAKLRPKLRFCIYQGKDKLRPWSKFPERENSDHGLSLGCLGVRLTAASVSSLSRYDR